MTTMPKLTAAALGLLALAGAQAQQLAVSGYGTLGWARSNRDFTYQRFITRDGGFDRDSVLGVQADLKLTPQWSATVQLKAAPSATSDARWDVEPSWAFVAWRPGDDWLVRAGKLRLPTFVYSEAMDVGQTHDMARLPTELYAMVPSYDVTGVYVTRTWALGRHGDAELSTDLFHGGANTAMRFWSRDGAPDAGIPAGANFADVHMRATGGVVTLRQPGLMLRGSLTRTRTASPIGEMPVSYPFVTLGPGIGYYQISNAMPGPGVPTVSAVHNTVVSLGTEWSPGGGWRVAAEFMRNRQEDTELAFDAKAGYVALFRQFGRFTPYLSYSWLGSRSSSIDWYRRLTTPTMPAGLPGAAQLNAMQRVAGEAVLAADQRSQAVGASYALGPTVKLKGEWLHSRIGRMSRLVDTPPGTETPHDTSVDVLTVNLNFAF